MNKLKYSLIATLLFTASISFGQWADIKFYADIMVNAEEASHRLRAADTFKELFDVKIKKSRSFTLNLSDLKWVSKIYNQDSTTRIITWEVRGDNDTYDHFGYIQRGDGTLIELHDASNDIEDVEYVSTDQNEWYGALYYNIKEFVKDGRTMFLLFGYDGHGKYDRRKIVDVVSYLDHKTVTFGAELFLKEEEGMRSDKKQRLLLEYSADSNVTLNFNPGLNMIVHDHLIRRIGSMPGQGATNLSDGSLVGYQYRNGMWTYVDRIYDQTNEVAPRPQPILVKKKKNLFGKTPTK